MIRKPTPLISPLSVLINSSVAMHNRVQSTVSSEKRPIVLKNRILSNVMAFIGFNNDLDITAT